MNRTQALQKVCVKYLKRLRGVAERYGLQGFVDDSINASTRGECEPTEKECEMLARIANEERLMTRQVPPLFDISYREAFDSGLLEDIKKFPRPGNFSTVDTLVHKLMREDK